MELNAISNLTICRSVVLRTPPVREWSSNVQAPSRYFTTMAVAPRSYFFGLLVLLACQRGPAKVAEHSGQRETLQGSVVSDDVRVESAQGASCPMWGAWKECSVKERLGRAGLVIDSATGVVRHEFLRVPGIVLRTYRAEVQVFLYSSEVERLSDTELLDSVEVAPKGRRVVWPQPAVLVTSGNLAAIVLSYNERLAERIALALGAGLPARPY
jgi:hypothetical protein